MGFLIQYGSYTAKGHGLPLLLKTVKSKKTKLSSRELFIEGFASIITIATGGSAGRIGPVVEIGSGIGDLIGHRLNINTDLYRTIIACGAAAGISSIFHAPLGGIFFVIEVIFKNFKKVNLRMIIISSIAAEVMVNNLLPGKSIFSLPNFHINTSKEYLFYAILGVFLGFLSFLFIKTLHNVNTIFDKIELPFFIKPAIGGMIIGLIGYFIPDIMGTGILSIKKIFTNENFLYTLLLLSILKIITTSITLGSGGSGGIFAPALLSGAAFGMFYGRIANIIFPSIVLSPNSYGLVGMAALISASIRAPLTGVLIIFELSGNYSLIIPLLFTSIIADLISNQLIRDSIYSPNLFLDDQYEKDD